MMRAALIASLALAAAAPAAAQRVQVDAQAMETLYAQQCQACHAIAERAPTRESLRQRTADHVIASMTDGVMKLQAAALSADQIRQLSVYLTGRQPGERLPVPIHDVKCASTPPIALTPQSWTKIAVDPANTAMHRNSGLAAADVPRLKLKWAFAFQANTYGQATVAGDRLFLSSGSGGGVYSLDAKTGCVHWKTEGISSRSTPMVASLPSVAPSGWATFLSANGNRVHALDAGTGKEIWRSEPVETVGVGRLTGTPALHNGKLYVPVSGAQGSMNRGACCTFRGSLVALDAKTGKKLWQTYVIDEPMQKLRVNADGDQLTGPAGAPTWSSPTIDAKRNQVYITTGNSYTEAKTKGADAIFALDLDTGAVKWSTQATPSDDFLGGCTRIRVGAKKPPSCPEPTGPDADFGSSAILATMDDGTDILVAGQKSADVHGLDPDTGKVLWTTKVGAGSSIGGVEWGMATDGRNVYAPVSDLVREHEIALKKMGQLPADYPIVEPDPGLNAVDLKTGKRIWQFRTPRVPCKFAPGSNKGAEPHCFHAQSQAVSMIPGVVFSGSTNGWLRALAADSGNVLWEFDATAQTYDTVNGVKGQPGSAFDSMAPSISNGVVYVMSGYGGASSTGNNVPNVLLAFSVDGK